ncbi:hypothetical protein [Streptomyces sp. NPDC004250]|uniref:hypothetical protein n=1 Tax=Streptomyces sp. NPDC004250 TaxID=3364692 RepID=UPI003684FE97
MTTKYALPWYEDLTDSVRALGEAAYEYQLAVTTARTLQAGVETGRRVLHEGKVAAQPRSDASGWNKVPVTRAPHEHAVFHLGDLYREQLLKLQDLYENASLCFATGCAWAIAHVQRGNNPNGVALDMGEDGRTLTPWTGPALEIKGLERYAHAQQVAAAYKQLAVCLNAAGYAEDLGSRDYLADHEASWMHDALDVAVGIGDAAYDYGLQAERALQFALLEPRRKYLHRQSTEDAAQS